MKLLFALTSLAALTSALMTSADKKGKDKLKGKKQIKVTADFNDIKNEDTDQPLIKGIRHDVPEPYKYLLWKGFTAGTPLNSADTALFETHTPSGPTSFGITKFHDPIVTAFDLRSLKAGCYSSSPNTTVIAGPAIGCTIQYTGLHSDNSKKNSVFEYTFRVNETSARNGVAVTGEALDEVTLPKKGWMGLKAVEVRVLENSVHAPEAEEVKTRMAFDDVVYRVHGKGLKEL